MAGEIDALRSRLQPFDGAMRAVHLDPALVRPSRWSNRHESVFSSVAFERFLDNIHLAGGNETPILVRQVDSAYEIVFGHRRHRACSELGLQVFAVVWVGPMSDIDLFLALERENRERDDLSPYDQGRMYFSALDGKLFKSQRSLAAAIGVSHTWVRKAIQIARLPFDLVKAFSDPPAIQPAHAEDIAGALIAEEAAVLRRAAEVETSKRTIKRSAAEVVDFLVGRAAPNEAKIFLRCGFRTVGYWRRDGRGRAVITLDANVSDDAAMARVAAAIEHALGDGLET